MIKQKTPLVARRVQRTQQASNSNSRCGIFELEFQAVPFQQHAANLSATFHIVGNDARLSEKGEVLPSGFPPNASVLWQPGSLTVRAKRWFLGARTISLTSKLVQS